MVVSMATTNLFGHPVFKDGAFTSNDRAVRRYAIAKTMRAIDLGAELGAPTYVFWGGREGVEAMAAKSPADALDRYREAIDFLCGYVLDHKYSMRFAIEPKPNEPRGDTFLPTVGHALAFIGSLEHPEMVGVNPETAHETMSGLSFYHAVAQAIWHGKLFHIDLNGQKIGRYDQDLRFGSEGLKDAFFLVKLLEESGYQGPRHFDAHAYRGENAEGVWDFATGCMRTYLLLGEKAKAFAADKEIQAALAESSVPELAEPTVGAYSPEAAAALRAQPGDPNALAIRGYRNERLDQLVIELLMGAR
jgi:xylose isomerase